MNIEVDIQDDEKGWYADIAITYTEQSEKGGERTYNIDKKVYLEETDITVQFGICSFFHIPDTMINETPGNALMERILRCGSVKGKKGIRSTILQ